MKNILSMLCGFFALISCNSIPQEDAAGAAIEINESVATLNEAQIKNAEIEIGAPIEREVSSQLKLNGMIDVPPQNLVSISAPLGGYLKTTKLLTGTHVRKGEVLAVLEDQQYIQLQQDYLSGINKIGFLEKELLRQKVLNGTQAASDRVLQQATLDFENQQIVNNGLLEKLHLAGINPKKISNNNISRSINILSPIDGYVSHVNVNIGKYVMPQDVMFELVNPQDIHLGLKVFEKDLDKIKVGQKVIAYTNNHPDKKYECEVILVGKDLSAERTAEIHSHFESYDRNLIPGMYMNAEIELDKRKATVVPEDAVVSFDGKEYVFVSKGKNSFEMLEVQIGDTENGFIEIKNTPIIGSQLVTKGAYALLMFLKNKSEE